MKIVKKIVLIVVVIIAIPLVVALFVQKDYAVEKEISIQKSKEEVFNYIKYLKNQENYSKWAKMDPNMKRTYSGEDATVGFIAGWESENPDVGRGEQEIVGMVEGEKIDYELRFFEPFESVEPAYMTTTTISDTETSVKWGFSGHMDYPMNLMFLFMDFEQMIGDDLQEGLDDLKKVMEE